VEVIYKDCARCEKRDESFSPFNLYEIHLYPSTNPLTLMDLLRAHF